MQEAGLATVLGRSQGTVNKYLNPKYPVKYKNLDADQKANLTNLAMLMLLKDDIGDSWAQQAIEPFTTPELQSNGWSNQRCLPKMYSTYVPPPKVRNKSKKAAADEAEGEEERKAAPFDPAAKTLLALAASRESFRESNSKSPLYADSFYTNVSKALITAKHVSISFDRTMVLTKQFYQTNEGREWRMKLAGLKTDGSTEKDALAAIRADFTKKRKRS